MRLQPDSIPGAKSSACGANAFLNSDCRALKNGLARVGPGLSPPDLIVHIKALACELPVTHQLPLSRWSAADLARYAHQCGLVASISGSTVWRWLHEDAIRPWRHRAWIFPRDAQFATKAGRILDLYERVWNQRLLTDEEFVLCADEKTSIQARQRRHTTYPARP